MKAEQHSQKNPAADEAKKEAEETKEEAAAKAEKQ